MSDMDRRIADALSRTQPSGDVKALLADVRAVYGTIEATADRLDDEALSPLLSADAARDKRRLAENVRFDADRLDAAVSALARRVCELEDSERAAEHGALKAAAIAERDELATDIAERWPALIAEMAGLVRRILENDRRCAALGIRQSAEEIARGIPCSTKEWDGGLTVARLAAAPPMTLDGERAWRFNLNGLVVPQGA